MDISPRKCLKKSADHIDDWLQKEGYFRKGIPRDPTCLFRAFAEQIYSTQLYHIRVRKECVEFMRKNHRLFEQKIIIPLDIYLEQMSCCTEWGGPNEIRAMSLLYEKEIFLFDGFEMTAKLITDNGFDDTLYLCHTPQKQYESVYPRELIATTAFCQSLVYRTLYKEVFKMPNVEETVNKMLHDRTANFRHDRFFLRGNLNVREKLTTELLGSIDKEADNSEEEGFSVPEVTPFPYRVAKALDPNIYRNTDFDVWHEIRREVKNGGWKKWNVGELQVGGKCLVQVDLRSEDMEKGHDCVEAIVGKDDESSKESTTAKRILKNDNNFLYGHIQEMSKNEGPVVVFIEELGEKRTVPYASLTPIVRKRNKRNNWNVNHCRKNSNHDASQKWKRTWNSNNNNNNNDEKKSKETNSMSEGNNSVDRNNNNDNDNKLEDDSRYLERKESWEEESGDHTVDKELINYSEETYNSCQEFTVQNTMEKIQPNVQSFEERSENFCPSSKYPASNEIPERGGGGSSNVEAVNPELIIQPFQQVSVNSPGEVFYPQSGIPAMFPVNQNILFHSPDGNTYPLPYPCYVEESPTSGNFYDNNTPRGINISAPASLDPNGNDLPFSDPVTLRFFYNLGLECFRTGPTWPTGSNGQPISFPSRFLPQGILATGSSIANETNQRINTGNEEDNNNSRSMNNPPRQNYGNSCRRNDNCSSNFGKSQNAENATRNEENAGENVVNNERTRENVRKNFTPSRFKKNDGRSRNFHGNHSYQQENQQNSSTPLYNCNVDAACFEKGKKNCDASREGHQNNWQLPVSQQSPPANQRATNFQNSYAPHTIFATLPIFPNDPEALYPPSPNFYHLPYVPLPSEIIDPNSHNNLSGPIVPSVNNYGHQPWISPYVFPQPTLYSGIGNQPSHQENWFPLPPGQSHHLVQYPQIPNSQMQNSQIQNPQTPPNNNRPT